MEKTIVCPISQERVNESVVRVIASFVFLLSMLLLLTGAKWIGLLLILDFYIRSFTDGNFSILKYLSLKIVSTLNITPKPIDAAPKKFAALVGLIFSVTITVTMLLQWNTIAWIFGVVLIICALLEAFIGYCVGCKFYTWIVLPIKKIVSKQ